MGYLSEYHLFLEQEDKFYHIRDGISSEVKQVVVDFLKAADPTVDKRIYPQMLKFYYNGNEILRKENLQFFIDIHKEKGTEFETPNGHTYDPELSDFPRWKKEISQEKTDISLASMPAQHSNFLWRATKIDSEEKAKNLQNLVIAWDLTSKFILSKRKKSNLYIISLTPNGQKTLLKDDHNGNYTLGYCFFLLEIQSNLFSMFNIFGGSITNQELSSINYIIPKFVITHSENKNSFGSEWGRRPGFIEDETEMSILTPNFVNGLTNLFNIISEKSI